MADYLDWLQPVEVVVDESVSSELWRMAVERCSGEVAIEKKGAAEVSLGSQDGLTASILTDAPIKRLSRMDLAGPSFAPFSSSTAITSENCLSSCENIAIRGLSCYLRSLLRG